MEYGSWLQSVELGCQVCLLIPALWALFTSAYTLPDEAAALTGVASNWQSPPQNWVGKDPCGSKWSGITCSNSHITEIVLSNLGISGTLTAEIGHLTELVHLDFSLNQGLLGAIPPAIGNLVKLELLILDSCSFTGSIPAELGMLSRLSVLSLNNNQLSGPIPGALGNLSSLSWLDITDNHISGSIPVSDGTNPGLDNLTRCQHFHFSKNSLSGPIPPNLFHSGMTLLHVLFDSNRLSGSIPTTLGLVKSLESVRLDRNELSGNVPPNVNNLSRMIDLHLSHNLLSGPLPNLTGLDALTYLDMGNNSFDESGVPSWFSTLPSLTTIMLEYSSISGQIPTSLFDFSPLQTASLRNNRFNGTLDLGNKYSSRLSLVDLQYNNIEEINDRGYSIELILVGNPMCNEGEQGSKYCTMPRQSNDNMYSTPTPDCGNTLCPPDQEMSPLCHCSYPYKGIIYFPLLKFSDINNSSHYKALEYNLEKAFLENPKPVISVSIQNPHMNDYGYLQIDLHFLPAGKVYFDESEISTISTMMRNQSFAAPTEFGHYYFIAQPYVGFQDSFPGAVPGSKSKKGHLVIVATVGVILLASILCLIIFKLHMKRKAKRAEPPFQFSGLGNPSKSSSSIPQWKGPRMFSFEEIMKCTKSFLEDNEIGSGAFGKVYRGVLADGQVVAVKRAKHGSTQGGLEFKTEIEMLSRVHHRNLVRLVGFCFDQNEQMLVYEYLPNGTLSESLSGKSGICLDWKRRLRVALGAARGLAYLHELAEPPIVHRDIKSNNILLDQRLNAKVSDFGLSRPLFDDTKGYLTTQVKGTMGYIDPEYYMSQQLTEKSDVYSFGIVLLELVTARKPLERGQYVATQVKDAIDKKKDLYNLDELLDPTIAFGALPGFERFMGLAMKCVGDSSANRPSMSEVVKEIENIMELAGMNPDAESASTTTASPPVWRGGDHPYGHSGETSSESSGGGPHSPGIEPK